MNNKKKIVFLGESTTGKTSIAYRLIKNEFPKEEIGSTIGASFMILTLNNMKYEIWDTAGQERYLSLVEMYYRKSDIVLLVFNLSDTNTICRLNYYLKKISENLDGDYKVLIIGNKLDLIKKENLSKIDKFVKESLFEFNFMKDQIEYIYISAKTGDNFEEFTKKLVEYGENTFKEEDKIRYKESINLNEIQEFPYNLRNYCYC